MPNYSIINRITWGVYKTVAASEKEAITKFIKDKGLKNFDRKVYSVTSPDATKKRKGYIEKSLYQYERSLK